MGTVIVSIILVLTVGGIIAKMISDRRKGKRYLSCGGNCSSCSSYGSCNINRSDKS